MKTFSRLAAIVALLQLAPLHAQPTRNFIWKVSRPSGAIYLVGSVHLLTKDYYPLSPALDRAFKDSDLLVEEADLGELEAPASQVKLLTRGLLRGGRMVREIFRDRERWHRENLLLFHHLHGFVGELIRMID